MDQFFIDNPEYANSGAKNKAIYENWKKNALDNKITFEGKYSEFHTEVKSEFETETGKTTIKTVRQLQSAAGSILPRIAEITTFTYITKNINYSAPVIKITTNSLLQNLGNLFDFKSKRIILLNPKYFIRTNNERICRKVFEMPLVSSAIKKNELIKFLSDSKSISITFRKVFKSDQEIENLILTLKHLDSILGNK
jgi:hypothetical protein